MVTNNTLIARFMEPTWGPSGTDRTQVDPILAPWTLLSGYTPSLAHMHTVSMSFILLKLCNKFLRASVKHSITISFRDVSLKLGNRMCPWSNPERISIDMSLSNHNEARTVCIFLAIITMMGAIASQITSLTIVYSTFYPDADQRKHQGTASLAFVRGIQRGPVNSLYKWPVTRKMFPFDDVTMVVSFFYM